MFIRHTELLLRRNELKLACLGRAVGSRGNERSPVRGWVLRRCPRCGLPCGLLASGSSPRFRYFFFCLEVISELACPSSSPSILSCYLCAAAIKVRGDGVEDWTERTERQSTRAKLLSGCLLPLTELMKVQACHVTRDECNDLVRLSPHINGYIDQHTRQ